MAEKINAKDRVPQTHKSILFEKFADDKDNLATLLELMADGDKESVQKRIANLEVKSFEEFVQKFVPDIYEFIEEDSSGRKYFKYSVKPQDKERGRPIKLLDHPYYTFLCELYEGKGGQGVGDIVSSDFDYKRVFKENLLPQAELERILDARKKILAMQEEFDRKTANKESADEEILALKKYRKEIKQKYNSPLALLPAMIGVTEERLKLVQDFIDRGDSAEAGERAALPKTGPVQIGAGGEITVMEIASHSAEALQESGGDSKAIAIRNIETGLTKDYERYALVKNDYVKDLVLNTYVPDRMNSLALPVSREAAIQEAEGLGTRLEGYRQAYAASTNAFIDDMKDLIHKVFNVKIFFDHATNKGKGAADLGDASLLVSNCNPKKLLKPNVRKELDSLLSRWVNHKDKKIWFGILPAVEYGSVEKAGGDNPWDEDLDDEEEILLDDDSSAISLTDAQRLLKLLDERKITTVFSFRPGKEYSFANLSAKNVKAAQNSLKALENNAHAVFAYPHFTLIKAQGSEVARGSDATIQVNTSYVDAAYVAAALLVASQMDNVLKKLLGNNSLVNGNVNVRVDLEDRELRPKLLTHFNRESISNWDEELKEAINENQFGFVFSGDTLYNNSKDSKGYLDRSYVYLARTMDKNEDGQYLPVYCTLTRDFIQFYLKSENADHAAIMNFLKRDVREWKDQAKMDPDKINLILHLDEDVNQSESDSNKLQVKFNAIDKPIEVEVENK